MLQFRLEIQDRNQSDEYRFPTTIYINNTVTNINNSIYWQGHTGTDGSWLTGLTNLFDQVFKYN